MIQKRNNEKLSQMVWYSDYNKRFKNCVNIFSLPEDIQKDIINNTDYILNEPSFMYFLDKNNKAVIIINY